jgi:hypothetical protein
MALSAINLFNCKINCKNRSLIDVLEVQKKLSEIIKILQMKLSLFNEFIELKGEKIHIKNVDYFQLCKIVDRKVIDRKKCTIESDKNLFKCVWPQYRYKTKIKHHLNDHFVRHSSEKLYKCDYKGCDKSYNYKCYLKRHNLIHSSIKMKCVWPQCKYETSIDRYLKVHTLIHSEEKNFKCDFKNCNKTFKQKCCLKSHKLIHSNEKKFICDWNQCDKKFKQKSGLIQHKNAVHLKLKSLNVITRDVIKDSIERVLY